jgi:hypothetical protein
MLDVTLVGGLKTVREKKNEPRRTFILSSLKFVTFSTKKALQTLAGKLFKAGSVEKND